MKTATIFLGLIAFAALAFIAAFMPSEASAYVPSTQMCWYRNIGSSSYVCPPIASNPDTIVGGTSGVSATAFNNAVGMNVHLDEVDAGAFPKYIASLQYMNIHHVRHGLSLIPGNSTIATYVDQLGAVGIKTDFLIDSGVGSGSIASALTNVNANQDVEALEGPNELNNIDSNWRTDDPAEMQQIWSYKQANHPDWWVIGPAISSNFINGDDYADMGDLSAYETYGNTHDYTAGFYPEFGGSGGAVYGYGYGSVRYNFANAQQSSPGQAIVPTEFSNETRPGVNNNVDPGAQAEYVIRNILLHNQLGAPRSYIYDLLDTEGQYFGIQGTTISGAYKIGYSEFAGFMNILQDPGTYTHSCTVPATVNTDGVSSSAYCFSDGRYALVLWQPVASWVPLPNQGSYNTVAPINASISYSPGFQPSSVGQWSYPMNGQWSFVNAPSTYPVTTRPSVVIFNGPTVPAALPTPPPNNP